MSYLPRTVPVCAICPSNAFLSFSKGLSLNSNLHDLPNPVLTTSSERCGEMPLYLNNSIFCFSKCFLSE